MKPRIAIPIPNSADPNYAMRALPQYENAIREAGGEPVIIDVNAGSNRDRAEGEDLRRSSASRQPG